MNSPGTVLFACHEGRDAQSVDSSVAEAILSNEVRTTLPLGPSVYPLCPMWCQRRRGRRLTCEWARALSSRCVLCPRDRLQQCGGAPRMQLGGKSPGHTCTSTGHFPAPPPSPPPCPTHFPLLQVSALEFLSENNGQMAMQGPCRNGPHFLQCRALCTFFKPLGALRVQTLIIKPQTLNFKP